jgi:hypothetical protein
VIEFPAQMPVIGAVVQKQFIKIAAVIVDFQMTQFVNQNGFEVFRVEPAEDGVEFDDPALGLAAPELGRHPLGLEGDAL